MVGALRGVLHEHPTTEDDVMVGGSFRVLWLLTRPGFVRREARGFRYV